MPSLSPLSTLHSPLGAFGALPRICLISRDSLSSALHNRWFSLSLGALLMFVFFTRLLSRLPFGNGGSGPKLFFDLGQTVIQVFAGATLILLLAHQFHSFVEKRISHVFLMRRLSRMEFILGKGLGVWIAVGLAVGVADAFHWLLLHGQIAGLGNGSDAVTTLPGAGVWAQLLALKLVALLIITGIGLFLASLSGSFLFTALAGLLLYSGSLVVAEAHFLLDSAQGAGGSVLGLAQFLLPQFQTWNLSSRIWYEGMVPMEALWRAGLAGLGYTALFASLAVFLFRRRDL